MTSKPGTSKSGAPAPAVVLPQIPSLGSLYAQAVGRQVQTAIRRRSRVPDLPELTYEVAGLRADAAHLTEYQHLLGMRAGDALPAGFVHVLGFPLAVAIMAQPDFPLPLLGMVHASNRVAQTRVLGLGEDLTVRAWAQNLAAHRSGTQVELVVEVDGAGAIAADLDPAWRGVSTYLARGVTVSGLPQASEHERDTSPNPEPTGMWNLDAGVGRAYAKVSGDVNPIHMSALSAKLFGFPRAIAHGMYTSSRALAEVGPRAGEAFDWTVDFAAPVLLPGRVSIAITDTGDGYSYRGWGKRLNFAGGVKPA